MPTVSGAEAPSSTHISIIDRKEIIAPPHFVSVFHETKEEFIPQIDREGLRVDSKKRNIGGPLGIYRKNWLMDTYRPEHVVQKGVSRCQALYGYPYLEEGHGIGGAAARFEADSRDEKKMKYKFDNFVEFNPRYLQEHGIKTLQDFINYQTDPDHLRSAYPGEVLELKVDPSRCYVGDMEWVTRIKDLEDRGYSLEEAVKKQSTHYWEGFMSLEDFLKWYRKPEVDADGEVIGKEKYRYGDPWYNQFSPLKDAPSQLPDVVYNPEVLIVENVPQEHIRLLPDIQK